jgi:hypothetical protein
MTLATCVDTETKIRTFDEFCTAIREYILVPEQSLNNELFTDEEFEAVAQLNDAFGWPDNTNWVNWREGLRQIFFYAQLSEHQLSVLERNNLSWLQGAPFFLHISNSDPSQVAYLPEREDKRVGDLMQRGRVGRFFTNHLEIDNQNVIREMTAGFQSTNYRYVLSRDPEMFARVYEKGPRSCMSHGFENLLRHPAFVYGSGDFAILASYPANETLDNRHLAFSGRAIISIANNAYIRIYGNEESIKEMMDLLNVDHGRNRIVYDRLLKINDRGTILPYFDADVSINDDPLSPRSGSRARLRCSDRHRQRQLNRHSQNGRVRWSNAQSSNYEFDVPFMEEHDRQVPLLWDALNTRFLELTSDPTERVIRPIIWNGRPVVETYQCCLCGETHNISNDRSNIVEVTTMNGVELAAKSHFWWHKAPREAHNVFAYREVTEHVLFPEDAPNPDYLEDKFPLNISRIPIRDVSEETEKWATYDFIVNNSDDFYLIDTEKPFEPQIYSLENSEDTGIFGGDFLLYCPDRDVKQSNFMDARFNNVTRHICGIQNIMFSPYIPGESTNEQRLMLFMALYQRFANSRTDKPDYAYKLLNHSWRNWAGPHNTFDADPTNRRYKFLVYLIYKKSRELYREIEYSNIENDLDTSTTHREAA